MIPTSLDIAAATNAGKPIVAANPGHPSSTAFAPARQPADRRARAPRRTSERGDRADADERTGRRFRKRR